MDPVCPPSTVFASYNAYPGPKRIEVYEWDGHEGGRAHFAGRSLEFLSSILKPG
jgi:cephalosporin-C deacetylase